MKILMVGEGGVSDEIRLAVPAVELTEQGHDAQWAIIRSQKDEPPSYKFDVVIFLRPGYPPLIEKARAAGAKIVIDMDDDFWSIPKTHVGYNAVGPGNAQGLAQRNECMYMADVITTASTELKTRLERFGKPVIKIPNGWTSRNSLWFHRQKHQKTALGWCGTITHREDFKLALPDINKAVRQCDFNVVIGGDPEIYRMLDKIPEKNKLFSPMVIYAAYPYMLSWMDILLAPLVDDEFNRAKSDIKLLDAGVRKIPWIASPLPQYREWGSGGIFANGTESWYSAMQILVDPKQSAEHAEAGHEKAMTREGKQIAKLWMALLNNL